MVCMTEQEYNDKASGGEDGFCENNQDTQSTLPTENRQSGREGKHRQTWHGALTELILAEIRFSDTNS